MGDGVTMLRGAMGPSHGVNRHNETGRLVGRKSGRGVKSEFGFIAVYGGKDESGNGGRSDAEQTDRGRQYTGR